MSVEIAPSQLDSRLTRAQELMKRGKERQALNLLWEAEALARGNADALQQASDVAAVLQPRFEPRQASQLAELIEVLRQDMEVAARATAPRADPAASLTPRSVAKGIGIALLWAASGGIAGVIIGAIVGRATENPNELMPSLDPIVGAIIGFPIGAIVGLVLCLIWMLSRTATQPPHH